MYWALCLRCVVLFCYLDSNLHFHNHLFSCGGNLFKNVNGLCV